MFGTHLSESTPVVVQRKTTSLDGEFALVPESPSTDHLRVASTPNFHHELKKEGRRSGRIGGSGTCHEKAWFKAICLTRWDPVFGPRTDRIWLTRSEEHSSPPTDSMDEAAAQLAAQEEKKNRTLLSQTYSELAEKLLTNL